MDLSLLFTPLSPEPLDAKAERITLRGAIAPIHLAREWVPPATAANWLLANSGISRVEQLRAVLAANDTATAWAMLQPADLADPELRLVLANWSARTQAELKLPAPRDGVIVIGDDGSSARSLGDLVNKVMRDLDQQWHVPWWPAWGGPIVVVCNNAPLAALPVDDMSPLARPALPILRIDGDLPTTAWREEIAKQLSEVTLANLTSHQTFPQWFHAAMIGVAQARARGEGPSPRRMHTLRQQAGSEAIRKTLLVAPTNPQLATAIGAVVCHRHRVSHMPALIELLRNGVDSLSALEIAYNLSVQDLIDQR